MFGVLPFWLAELAAEVPFVLVNAIYCARCSHHGGSAAISQLVGPAWALLSPCLAAGRLTLLYLFPPSSPLYPPSFQTPSSSTSRLDSWQTPPRHARPPGGWRWAAAAPARAEAGRHNDLQPPPPPLLTSRCCPPCRPHACPQFFWFFLFLFLGLLTFLTFGALPVGCSWLFGHAAPTSLPTLPSPAHRAPALVGAARPGHEPRAPCCRHAGGAHHAQPGDLQRLHRLCLCPHGPHVRAPCACLCLPVGRLSAGWLRGAAGWIRACWAAGLPGWLAAGQRAPGRLPPRRAPCVLNLRPPPLWPPMPTCPPAGAAS